MSESRGYRNPVMISCGSAFTEADNSELLDRHSRYGVAFREAIGDPAAVLTVLVPDDASAGSLLSDRDALRVYSLGPHKNPFAIGLAAGRWARRRGLLPYWIAGTPFREAIAAITAQRIRQGPLQIQAHGNFGVLSPWSGPFSDRARWLVARLTFPRANSVRTVSPEQRRRLLSTFHIDPEISFIARVPLNRIFLDSPQITKLEDDIFRIGWFGRLHRERNFEAWISKARSKIGGHANVELNIIGDGPDKEELEIQIARSLPGVPVVWKGHLSGENLVAAVSQLDLVIFSVSNEAGGRGILEVLICGVSISAIQSPTVKHLLELLVPEDESGKPIETSEDGQGWIIFTPSRDRIRSAATAIETAGVQLLANSWVSDMKEFRFDRKGRSPK